MKVQKSDILNVLNILSIGLGGSTSSFEDLADKFVFTKEGWALVYNSNVLIMHPFNLGFDGAFPAKEMIKIIESVTNDTMEIKFSEDQLNIKGSSTKGGLLNDSSSLTTVTQLLSDMLEEHKWYKLPFDFIKGIRLCEISVCHDQSDTTIMANIYVDGQHIVTTDNYRISVFELAKKLRGSILLPDSSIRILLKLNPVYYFIGESWTGFKNDAGTLFYVRKELQHDTFPNMLDFFFDKNEGVPIVLPEELKSSLHNLAVFTDGDDKSNSYIQFTLHNNGELVCKGTKDVGWLEKTFNVEYNGSDLSFKINPFFLSYILDESNVMIYKENKALFVKDEMRHLMLLYQE